MDYVPPKTEIHQQVISTEFKLHANTAQYKGSDYSNAIRVERGVTLEKAFEIAHNDPSIDYFVYVKGYQMVLEVPSDAPFDPMKDPFGLVAFTHYQFDTGRTEYGACRIFGQGDVVFFKKEGLWLGSAPGLADTYTIYRK